MTIRSFQDFGEAPNAVNLGDDPIGVDDNGRWIVINAEQSYQVVIDIRYNGKWKCLDLGLSVHIEPLDYLGKLAIQVGQLIRKITVYGNDFELFAIGNTGMRESYELI